MLRAQRSQETLSSTRSAHMITPNRSPLPVVQAHSLPISSSPLLGLSTLVAATPVHHGFPNLKLSSESSHDTVATVKKLSDSRPQCKFLLPNLTSFNAELRTPPNLPVISPTPPPSAQTNASGCLSLFPPSRGSSGTPLSGGMRHRPLQQARSYKPEAVHSGTLDVLGTSPSCLSLWSPGHGDGEECSQGGTFNDQDQSYSVTAKVLKMEHSCGIDDPGLRANPCNDLPKHARACKPPVLELPGQSHTERGGGAVALAFDLEAWGKRDGLVASTGSPHLRSAEAGGAFAVRGRRGKFHAGGASCTRGISAALTGQHAMGSHGQEHAASRRATQPGQAELGF